MPLTPVTWLPETLVESSSPGSDSDSQVVQLANGNFLIVWTAYANGSYNIWGRIYDPFGESVSDELHLAANAYATNMPAIGALPDGGFLVVYEEDTGAFDDIPLQQYSADGSLMESAYAFYDPISNADPSGFTPEIAVSSAVSALVVWEETTAAGGSNIMGRIWNSETEDFTTASLQLLSTNSAYTYPYVDVTTLSNGNYVIVATREATYFGDTALFMRILTPVGTNVLGVTAIGETLPDNDADIEPSVTALTGGGFVVTWRNTDLNDDDILFQVFDASGTATSAVSSASYGGAGDVDNEPVVVALSDGGFMILYDDDGDGELVAARFDADGDTVGGQVTIAVGAGYTQPNAALLADGRVVISYTLNSSVYFQILDTRDEATVGDMPLDGVNNDYWAGTTGDDTFTVTSGNGDVHGWDGNDDITESGAIRDYYGDDGDDTIRVTSGINSDRHDGGAGNDLIDFSALSGGYDIDLSAGLVSYGGFSEVMVNFENATGSSGNDVMAGTDGTNLLRGGAGDDTIFGNSGFGDTLYGEGGNDLIMAVGVADEALAHGGNGDDTIAMINNYFAGDVNGGAGTDTFDASDVTISGMYLDLAAGTHEYMDYGGLGDLLAFENVIGTQMGDEITGDGVANLLDGQAGNDTIDSGAGADTVEGGDGADSIYGNTGDDSLLGGNGDDTIGGGSGNDYIAGGADNDVITSGGGNDTAYGGSGNDDIDGSGGNDTLYGNSGADSILGGDGSDSLNGGEDNDTLLGGAGDDSLLGGDDDDVLDGGINNDYLAGEGGNDSLVGGGNADRLYGGAGDDTLLGGTGYDTLAGGAGNDQLDGGDHIDYLSGGDGDDSLYGGNDNDVLDGGANNDYLAGESGDDSLYGGANSDRLYGGSGNDTLDGGAGYDTLAGGAGDDQLFGGDHIDYLSGGSGNDTLDGGTGTDQLYGEDGADALYGGDDSDTLDGGTGNDLLYGGSGDDTMYGGANGDTLYGQSGNDTLDGGRGWDRMSGGGGADVFLFSEINAGENDTITDFADGVDRIEMVGVSFGDLTITAAGGNTEIEVDGHTITLFGVSAASLTAADFIFS